MFDSRADVIELSKMQNDMIPDSDTGISIHFEENKAVIEGLGKIRRTQTFADMISQKVLQHGEFERDNYMRHFRLFPSCDPRSGGPPYFTILITIACIGMHIMTQSDCDVNVEKCWAETKFYLSADQEINRDETWRYLSYSLLHLDSMHLMSNMLIFFPTGIILELVHGSARIASIFVLGVIFGALGHLAWQEGGALIGASAGCYAILGTNIANVIKNGDVMNRSFLAIRVVFWGMVLLGVAYETYIGFTHDPEDGVSWSAHGGGFWTGLSFGFWSLSNFEVHTWERVLEVLAGSSFWISFIYNALRR